jgi:translation initiation factor IF-1
VPQSTLGPERSFGPNGLLGAFAFSAESGRLERDDRQQRETTVAGRRTFKHPPGPRPVAEPSKEAPLELFGTVRQVFPSTTFAVELENGQTILAHIAGRLRRHRIKILPGDRVDLEMSPYDLTKGRIVYRYRAGEARRS